MGFRGRNRRVWNAQNILGSLSGSVVKNPPVKQETWVWSLGQKDALEKEMVTHSSNLAWDRRVWRASVHGVTALDTTTVITNCAGILWVWGGYITWSFWLKNRDSKVEKWLAWKRLKELVKRINIIVNMFTLCIPV